MTETSEAARVAENLWGWTTDWDGSWMKDGEPPRDGLHCDALREAASIIGKLHSQAKEARSERDALRDALKVTSAILQAEMYRSSGKPFSGTWTIPAFEIRATCDDALDQANAALGEAKP